MLKNLVKTIFLIIYFFLIEIKQAKTNLINLVNFYKQLKLIPYFKGKIVFKNKYLNNFLKLNSEVNSKKIIQNYTKKDKIIVESLINHPLYTIPNCIIASKLKEIYNLECIGIIREGDIVAERIMKSFNINSVIKLNRGNFFLRFFFYIKAIMVIGFDRTIKWLVNYKSNKIEIGKNVYEHYVRNKKIPGPKKISAPFFKFFSDALFYDNQFKNIFKNIKISYWVQAEHQFIPYRILFQNALLKKAKVIARFGVKKVSIRKYKNFSEKNSNRSGYNKKLIKYLFKNYKHDLVHQANKRIDFNLKKKIGNEDRLLNIKSRKKRKFRNKNELCKHFSWEKNKPLVLIFAHELTDGNFNNKWNLFLDDKDWLIKTLKKIKKIKNVNWIIKPHPSEIIYNSKINTRTIFKEMVRDNDKNIRLFPEEYEIKNFYKFISVAITSHGTPGYQYPALGVPTIVCGDSSYYGLGFNLEPKTQFRYFKILSNIKKLKPLTKEQQDRSKVFWYVFNFLGKAEIPSIYYSDIKMTYDRKKFWKESLKLLKKHNQYRGNFYESFEYQLKNNNSNLINLEKFSKIKKNNNLKNFN